MALRLLPHTLSSSQSKLTNVFPSSKSFDKLHQWRTSRGTVAVVLSRPGNAVRACATKLEEMNISSGTESEWGKVSAVLFDMDGVLCNSEVLSRLAAVDVFAEMGVQVTVDDFIPFMGVGEANFLGGVASVKNVKGFDPVAAKKRFFEIYLEKYAKPNSGIGFPGALELITQCKNKGLKVAVASSADRIKVDANLAAAGLPLSMFDAIVSADAFENLKPAPDIFNAASEILNVPPSECVVIEDALAGVQAAEAANMRCIAVTTTLTEDSLKEAGPSFVRKDIGNITLQDILTGGSSYNNTKMQEPEPINNSVQTSVVPLEGTMDSFQGAYSAENVVFSIGGPVNQGRVHFLKSKTHLPLEHTIEKGVGNFKLGCLAIPEQLNNIGAGRFSTYLTPSISEY